jgi:integrase
LPSSIGRSGNYIKKALGPADDHADADGTTLSYRDAIEKTLAWVAELSRLEADRPFGAYRVSDAVRDYLAEHYAKEGRAITQTSSIFDHHILPTLGDKLVSDLRTKEINSWLMALVKAPKQNRGKKVEVDLSDPEALRKRKASANRILTMLKTALNHAYRNGRIGSDDAWRRVSPFKRADAPKIRFLTTTETIRLLNACLGDFQHLVRGAVLTGARYGELSSLIRGDVNLDAGLIHIRESKSGRDRHVPLSGEGVEWFKEWTRDKEGSDRVFSNSGRIWTKSSQTRPMAEACKRANIAPAISFHILRHCYASSLVNAGVSINVISELLGHADGRMAQRHYAHLAPSYVADQVKARLPALGAPDTKK